ncbi:hypothetical protein ABVK25_011487 [Lepraria finkii]|uniref:Uncharacterized protein n=1 Tax=Lepraria finkii TaxID=1340010 RepID=A0ABR4AQE7_9LECA
MDDIGDDGMFGFPYHRMHDNYDGLSGIGTRALPTSALDVVPSTVDRRPKELADVIALWAYDEGRKHSRYGIPRDSGVRFIFETANGLKT